MGDRHLATYLNDHLAGSVVAVELLEHLERAYAGKPVEQFAHVLRADITQDQQQLEALMSALDVAQARTRTAFAWLTEKLTQLKLRVDDVSGGDFRLFEALEALSLGIEGKKLLWENLAAAAGGQPALRIANYPDLIRRALEQRRRVDAERSALVTKTLSV